MNNQATPGIQFRALLNQQSALQIAGTINAYSALLAQRSGFESLYLSGAGVANASFGLPDLGLTSLQDVAEDVRRISQVCCLPLLVDADTAWDDPAETVEVLSKAGAAAIHIEDQVDLKRCGHRPGKHLVSIEKMQQRMSAAVNASEKTGLVIMARTDAHAVEGFSAAVQRSQAYVEAGAEMIFAEAFSTLEEYQEFVSEIQVPVLANITEFGKTPLFTVDELSAAGIKMVLYPLSAFRAMSAASLEVYQAIRQKGTQKDVVDKMQTRKELYEVLDYEKHEQRADKDLA